MFKYIIFIYLLILNSPKINLSTGTQGKMSSTFYQQEPFYNPNVPLKTVIRGGLYPGKSIHIQGLVSPHAYRFVFNLYYRGGIAFHYNPRFDQNMVARNTLKENGWGSEENSGPMPFVKGQSFQVVITCEPNHFNVMVNGNQAHKYNHRVTKLEEIDVLIIEGDLKLTFVTV